MTLVIEPEEAKRAHCVRILLAEDNPADRKLVVKAFQKVGLESEIFSVANGEEALDYLKGRGAYRDRDRYPLPNLILMDIQMPKMNGMEALQKIKADPELAKIPIVMMTTSTDGRDVVRCYSHGAASFITKPVEYDEFLCVVEGFSYYWHLVSRVPGDPFTDSFRSA